MGVLWMDKGNGGGVTVVKFARASVLISIEDTQK